MMARHRQFRNLDVNEEFQAFFHEFSDNDDEDSKSDSLTKNDLDVAQCDTSVYLFPAVESELLDIDKDETAAEQSNTNNEAHSDGGLKNNEGSNAAISQCSYSSDDYSEILKTYNDVRSSSKPPLYLAVVGNVNAGKSTLVGHLLVELGCVQQYRGLKSKDDRHSRDDGFAMVVDEMEEERLRGLTMDIAQVQFETLHHKVTLLDTPGHRDFTDKLIAGLVLTDVALVIIDASDSKLETGDVNPIILDHLIMLKSTGVSQIAIAVNKMDKISWDADRYTKVKSTLSVLLNQLGFQNNIRFIPCSGLSGGNLIATADESSSWYAEGTVMDAINSFTSPDYIVAAPFRLCVSSVYREWSGWSSVAGKVQSGFVRDGDTILIMPVNLRLTVKCLVVNGNRENICYAGDYVVMNLAKAYDTRDILIFSKVNIICHISQPLEITRNFKAQIVTFNSDVPITNGLSVVLHIQCTSCQATVKKLISKVVNGKVVRKSPRVLTKNSCAFVEIETATDVCVDVNSYFKKLAIFVLRSGNLIVATGLVKEIL